MTFTVAYAKINQDACEPTRGSERAAGYDLYSVDEVLIPPGHKEIIHTGICFEIPEGHYGRVAPRSGLASKHGIDVLAGVCDEDYKGEICVILINHGKKEVWIQKGDRVAQFIFEKITIPDNLVEISHEDFTATKRGTNGFGSTGR